MYAYVKVCTHDINIANMYKHTNKQIYTYTYIIHTHPSIQPSIHLGEDTAGAAAGGGGGGAGGGAGGWRQDGGPPAGQVHRDREACGAPGRVRHVQGARPAARGGGGAAAGGA